MNTKVILLSEGSDRARSHNVIDDGIFPAGSKIWKNDNGAIRLVQLSSNIIIDSVHYAQGMLIMHENGYVDTGILAEPYQLSSGQVISAGNEVHWTPDGRLWLIIVQYSMEYSGNIYPSGTKVYLEEGSGTVRAVDIPDLYGYRYVHEEFNLVPSTR